MFINRMSNERHGELNHILENRYFNGHNKVYPNTVDDSLARTFNFPCKLPLLKCFIHSDEIDFSHRGGHRLCGRRGGGVTPRYTSDKLA